jgi:hypothetical protein
MESGGFASTLVDGTQMLYYETYDNNIVEEQYANSNWTFQNPNNPNNSITGFVPGVGNTIAALSYTVGGLAYRSLFFIDSSGNIITSNTTSKLEETTVWSQPWQISTLPAYPVATVGLAACVDTNVNIWNGIMVLYGDTQGNLRALGYDFASASKGWVDKTATFGGRDADAQSGLGCTISAVPAGPILNVYTRIPTLGTFIQTVKFKSAVAGTDYALGKQMV